MEPIEKQLTELTTEVRTFAEKAKEETKNLGAVTTETKATLDTMRTQMLAMQTQLDAVDAKSQQRLLEEEKQAENEKPFVESLTEHKDFLEHKEKGFISKKPLFMEFSRSAFPRVSSLTHFTKSVLTGTGLGSGTGGVVSRTHLGGPTVLARQELRVRDLMNVRTISEGNSFDWLKQSTRTNNASPQSEGSAKTESLYNYTIASDQIRTIAHYTNVSRQALADIPWLRTELDNELIYGLKLKEEAEILAGAGTGEHLNGIISQATAFNTGLMPDSNWTLIDVLRVAKLQSRLAGLGTYAPDGIVLHPTDMAYLELTKDANGLYIVGDPKTGAMVKFLWNLPVVESDSISQGTFIVGPFGTGATLIDRQFVSVEISYEHSDNFTRNQATILAEERIGLAVKTPTVFITGSMASSPA